MNRSIKFILVSWMIFLLLVVAAWAQQAVRVIDPSSGTAIGASVSTEIAHDAPLGTMTNVKGMLPFGRARLTSLPTPVSADDKGVAPIANGYGAEVNAVMGNPFGGSNTCYIPSAATTNATLCKNAPGTIYSISVINTTSALYYLRLYNLAVAPTCSSAIGFIESIPVPHNTGTGGGFVRPDPVGRSYGTGIGFCLTAGASNNDNVAAAAGLYVSIGYF